eukprot:CAMPEP_0118714812 /NCGR_PEP_ID=MMETSP0800-20121206/26441_1 /TAXON_ID=210618 ORGANISM="Striatella unipunctata, Strain CCMP2910" /NCGR_SAMPLE_ID=MMETSP0800 /ASSEMBLY_ACC=CAM_ASM_000638 /LENGTH=571 /DNA_ID=CAMNT_0006620739 /DNA_START=135 /DNA_END=1850 /DNA_ORIENTATION=-
MSSRKSRHSNGSTYRKKGKKLKDDEEELLSRHSAMSSLDDNTYDLVSLHSFTSNLSSHVREQHVIVEEDRYDPSQTEQLTDEHLACYYEEGSYHTAASDTMGGGQSVLTEDVSIRHEEELRPPTPPRSPLASPSSSSPKKSKKTSKHNQQNYVSIEDREFRDQERERREVNLQTRRRSSAKLHGRANEVIHDPDADFETKYNDLEVEYAALTLHADALCAELQTLHDKLQEEEEYITELEQDKQDIKMDFQDLRREKNRLEHENALLRKQVRTHKKENSKLKQDLNFAMQRDPSMMDGGGSGGSGRPEDDDCESAMATSLSTFASSKKDGSCSTIQFSPDLERALASSVMNGLNQKMNAEGKVEEVDERSVVSALGQTLFGRRSSSVVSRATNSVNPNPDHAAAQGNTYFGRRDSQDMHPPGTLLSSGQQSAPVAVQQQKKKDNILTRNFMALLAQEEVVAAPPRRSSMAFGDTPPPPAMVARNTSMPMPRQMSKDDMMADLRVSSRNLLVGGSSEEMITARGSLLGSLFGLSQEGRRGSNEEDEHERRWNQNHSYTGGSTGRMRVASHVR